jgi:hypothetical protein
MLQDCKHSQVHFLEVGFMLAFRSRERSELLHRFAANRAEPSIELDMTGSPPASSERRRTFPY